MQNAVPNTGGTKQNWFAAYCFLGIFTVFIGVSGAYFTSKIMNIYHDSVENNQVWAKRSAQFVKLGQIATKANGPGNDVFEDRDVAKNRSLLNEYQKEFVTNWQKAHEDVEKNVIGNDQQEMKTLLENVKTEFDGIVREANDIFANLEQDNLDVAGKHMAIMDRQLAATSDALTQLMTLVQDKQESAFQSQLAEASSLRKFVFLLLGLVFAAVGYVIFYGKQLKDLFQRSQDKITKSNKDMRTVLDNVSQGLITLSMDGTIASESSKAFRDFMSLDDAKMESLRAQNSKFSDILEEIDPHFSAWFEMGWESVQDGFLPLDLCLEQLPKRFTMNTRIYDVSYSSVHDDKSTRDDHLAGILLVITDVTDQLKMEQERAEQKELFDLSRRLTTDRWGTQEFYDETSKLIKQITVVKDPIIVKRAVHTIKGNSAIFGLTSVASLCHSIENRMSEENGLPSDEDVQKLQWVWDNLWRQVSRPEQEGVALTQEQYRWLAKSVKNGVAHVELDHWLRGITYEPVRTRLDRFAEQIKSVASRLGKSDIHVVVDAAPVRVSPSLWAPFWSSLVHVMRNAVDHGIENREQRTEHGKPEHGLISMQSKMDGNTLAIEIKDDGAGVDWERVRQKAARMGLPHTTHEDLVNAIFADGLSTREVVSDVSGRGAGLGAVRATCISLGGHVEVESQKGQGTTFRFVFDLKKMPDWALWSEKQTGSVVAPQVANQDQEVSANNTTSKRASA